MYKKALYVEFPTEDKPVGYDLIKGDRVKPYGEGEVSDFIFSVKKH